MKVMKKMVKGYVKGVGSLEVPAERIVDDKIEILDVSGKVWVPFMKFFESEKLVNVPDEREKARLAEGDCWYNEKAGCLMFGAR